MEILLVYLCGMITGALLLILGTLYMGKKALDKAEKSLAEAKKDFKGSGKMTLTERMARVKEITITQQELISGIDGPQKNSLHGKFKNGLNREVKALEEERNNLLRSIINDGYDPEISTVDGSGVVTKMKLSEYMVEAGITLDPPEDKSKTRQIGKFTVIKGGKDDGEGSTTH